MAARTLFGNAFRLTRERGELRPLDTRTRALATLHPSAILRMRGPERERAQDALLADLHTARATLGG